MSNTPLSDAAWDSLLAMLHDLGQVVRDDARDDRERLEGYRVLARVLALCSELSLDVDPDVPRFFAMTTPMRQVAGPNPDGEYDLCALTPGRSYRITGHRGSVTYLGFQVMAGTGLTPRRQATYVSDTDLHLDATEGSRSCSPPRIRGPVSTGSRSRKTPPRWWCVSTSLTAASRRSRPTTSSSSNPRNPWLR